LKKPPESSVWTIEVLDLALDQIGAFDTTTQKRIFRFLDRLPNHANPRAVGEALSGNWAGYWKYRIGDYRLICQIVDLRLKASWPRRPTAARSIAEVGIVTLRQPCVFRSFGVSLWS
jgi:mRNA interferase RelE/StbE